jgi:membrane-associated protease RseP (regulator of RpoE activity)
VKQVTSAGDAKAADPGRPKANAPAPSTNGASRSSGGENRLLSIVGLVRIGEKTGQVDAGALIGLFALINIFIGVFNLVPLLPFDGGHVAIAVYEKIQERRLHRARYFTDVTKLLPLTYAVVMVLGMIFFSSLYLDILNPIGV